MSEEVNEIGSKIKAVEGARVLDTREKSTELEVVVLWKDGDMSLKSLT